MGARHESGLGSRFHGRTSTEDFFYNSSLLDVINLITFSTSVGSLVPSSSESESEKSSGSKAGLLRPPGTERGREKKYQAIALNFGRSGDFGRLDGGPS